jgi:hypothetical protein
MYVTIKPNLSFVEHQSIVKVPERPRTIENIASYERVIFAISTHQISSGIGQKALHEVKHENQRKEKIMNGTF